MAEFESWVIVECLGRRVLSGRAQTIPFLGGKALRLDVALPEDEAPFTEFLMPSAIYGVIPCLQEEAEAWATQNLNTLCELGMRAWPDVQVTLRAELSQAVREWSPFVNLAAYS